MAGTTEQNFEVHSFLWELPSDILTISRSGHLASSARSISWQRKIRFRRRHFFAITVSPPRSRATDQQTSETKSRSSSIECNKDCLWPYSRIAGCPLSQIRAASSSPQHTGTTFPSFHFLVHQPSPPPSPHRAFRLRHSIFTGISRHTQARYSAVLSLS